MTVHIMPELLTPEEVAEMAQELGVTVEFLLAPKDTDDQAHDLSSRQKRTRLTRKPKAFEQRVVSLTDIPERLDAGVEALKEGLPPLLIDLALSGDEARAKANLTAFFVRTMDPIGAFGGAQVRLELSRQGVDVGGVAAAPMRLLTAAEQATEDALVEIKAIKDQILKKLARRRLRDDKRLKAANDELSRRMTALANRSAKRAVNISFAGGRRTELQSLTAPVEDDGAVHLARRRRRVEIEKLVFTAVLDGPRCCPECTEVDGTVVDVGSEEHAELEPPYYRCYGNDDCRCALVPLADAENI